ncbi:MAG TPA: NAD(P)/FAD-dependent oxidoreductase [Planctomycetota bacterium]|nr:NAD(P)/FAD-dependent oxidoreductase [Planctomycetota bacterium]
MSDAPYDVLVVGAGPAGAAASGLLAKAGNRVLVLEKDEFPRFHIGESLLPGSLPVLERLGIETTRDIFVYKSGAEFVCEATGRRGVFAFMESLPGCTRHAWHVDRARFDRALRDRAAALGAEIRHGVTVVDAGTTAEHAFVKTRDQTFTGRYLIDASGLSRLLARRAGTAVPYDRFGHSAAFTHYEGLGDAAVEELDPGHNNIRIMLRPEGWGWIIPLPDRCLSVGMVSHGKMTPAELEAGLLAGPFVQRLTKGTRRLETRITGNFSYRNTVPSGPRFTAVGDAACFLDPVFSSGVTLALRGAEAIADLVAQALADGTEASPTLLDGHNAGMDRAYRTFAGLIDRFYHTNLADSLFLGDTVDEPMRRGVMSVLAGDVWRTGNSFQEMLLAARRTGNRLRAKDPANGRQHDAN